MSIAPAPQSPGQPSPSAGPPMGSSPATQPVPNRGSEVMVAQGIGLITKLMGELLAKASSMPDAVADLADCIKKLSKYAAGKQNPAAEQEQMRALMMKQQQMSQLPQQKPPGA